MELHHSSEQEAFKKVTKLFLNMPLVALHLAKHIVPEPERLFIKIKLHASERDSPF